MNRMTKVLIGWVAGACLLLPSVRAQNYTEPYTFITIAGSASTFGNLDASNGVARFESPRGLAVDTNGNVYLVDDVANTVRKVAPVGTNWVVTTLAGTPGVTGARDGLNGAAQFYRPVGIAVDTASNLYVADTLNHTIREITPQGNNWNVTTIAGTAGNPGAADGTNARFNQPAGIAVDSAGNLYVADSHNNTIRKITPSGTNWVVTTIAGTNSIGSADGTNLTAQFNGPEGLAIDSAGNLFVADSGGDTIRKVTPVGTNWVVTTIAGSAGNADVTDGPGWAARFDLPSAIGVGTNGNVFVADTYNCTVRLLLPDGVGDWSVFTAAGTPGVIGGDDGIVQDAQFNYPFGLAADTTGHVFVSDTLNGTIRMGWFTPVPNVGVRAEVTGGFTTYWLGPPFFTLQTNADLTTTNWVDCGSAVVSVNGTNSIAFPPANQLFFRLRD